MIFLRCVAVLMAHTTLFNLHQATLKVLLQCTWDNSVSPVCNSICTLTLARRSSENGLPVALIFPNFLCQKLEYFSHSLTMKKSGQSSMHTGRKKIGRRCSSVTRCGSRYLAVMACRIPVVFVSFATVSITGKATTCS